MFLIPGRIQPNFTTYLEPKTLMALTTLPHLLLLSVVIVHGKPEYSSNPRTAPWDWKAVEQVDYAKYNMYEEEMNKMLEEPYFARVKNKSRVKKGEVAFLPCRVKEMGAGYTVSTQVSE